MNCFEIDRSPKNLAGPDCILRYMGRPVRRQPLKNKIRALQAIGLIVAVSVMTFVAANWHVVEAGRRWRGD